VKRNPRAKSKLSLRAARAQRRASGLRFERLEPRLARAAVIINEFLASNVDGVVDQDGDHSDWIELKNTSAAAVNLAGWRLTDDPGNLGKWTLPAIDLNPGALLRVFASDKNRRVAGQELHTNFKLAAEGEYLALVMPDGATIADSFAPYPAQRQDVSYGVGGNPATTAAETLVGASSALSVISPVAEDPAVDDHWREIGFNDASWLAGTRSVGFDRDGTNNFGPFLGRTLTTSEMPSTISPRYTAYVRYEFNVANSAQLTSLGLDLRFDDGFIAYLNGREVARANFGEDFARPQPSWDSRAGYQLGTSTALSATNLGAEALTPVTFNLTPYLPLLVDGENVLAFHLVNSASTSAAGSGQDLLLEPVLTAQRAGGSQLGFMTSPTPGAPNGVSTLGFVGDTHFSVDRGFFAAPFQVAVTADLPTASIRYTTDGSLPTPTTGTVYNGPITIAKTTILRAIAYQAGYTSSNVDTQTYIFLADVIGQNSSRVTQPYAPWGHDKDDSGTESGYNLDDEADWEMDPQIVGANMATILNDLQAIPTVSLVMNWNDLFGGAPSPGTPAGTGTAAPSPQGIYIHGTSSERAASFEYFHPNNPADQVHADVAVEIQGHSSTLRWNTDKLSLQVKFKFPYGDTELNYPLFAGAPDGANAAREFDTLILDAGYNYGWTHANPQQRDFARFVSDQVASDLQNLASGGGQAPHGKFVHLYLNGLYWGLYNLHERPDDSFAAEYFGGDKDDYYVVKSANQDVEHEYVFVEGGIAAERNYAALVAASAAVESAPANAANYAAVQAMLDIDQFIDYMIVHYYAGGGADWAHNNWYATRNATAGKWRFHAWDQEHAFPTTDNGDSWTQTSDLTDKDDPEAPTAIHRNLIVNEEYRLRFSDRVQELLSNGGALTPAVARGAYEARTAEIDRAIVAESARWGDNRVDAAPYTRADFVSVRDGVLNTFFPTRTATVLAQFNNRGWIPTLAAPLMSQYGGSIVAGYDLALTKPAGAPAGGVIYYTTNGTDPRLPGGGFNPAAQPYAAPIDLAASTRVQARIYFNNSGTANDWSPLVDKTFLVPDTFPLRIVELHYNPKAQPGIPTGEDLEFIELLNTGSSTISLNGVTIAGFATTPYAFPSGLTLAAGARIVVARTPAVFTQFYGAGIYLSPTGYGSANLSNGGELVVLRGPAGDTLQSFTFSDDPPWPTSPDGNGYSLEIVNPLGDPALASNWRASYFLNGSPGTDGLPPTAAPGDFNLDERVDGNDFLAWQRGVGLAAPAATRADGDADGDQDVDRDDFLKWAEHYGGAPLAAAVVAETAANSLRAAAAGAESPATLWRDGAWVLWDQWAGDAGGEKPPRSRVSRRALLAAEHFER
jgi:hypothetical protein